MYHHLLSHGRKDLTFGKAKRGRISEKTLEIRPLKRCVNNSNPSHRSKTACDIFLFSFVKTATKNPETVEISGFSLWHLFWYHNVVAGEGFEPTTSGLSLRAALRCPKKSSGLRFPRFFRPLRCVRAKSAQLRFRRQALPSAENFVHYLALPFKPEPANAGLQVYWICKKEKSSFLWRANPNEPRSSAS